MSETNKSPKLPPLQIPPELEPAYVNLARIMHSSTEMLVDFARFLPGMQAPLVTNRIILSPLSAKLLHRALGENLAKFESTFGEIQIPSGPSLADQLFRPHHPPSKPPDSDSE
ncbi:MAG: DUF3467 domain-containing protein [Chloroflexota bacterium]